MADKTQESFDLVEKLRQEDGSSYAAGLMQRAADEIDRLQVLLNPRRWTMEMNSAWNRNIPDLMAAFAMLRECEPQKSPYDPSGDNLFEHIFVNGDVINIYGIAYSGELFRDFGNFLKPGQVFRFEGRENGCISLTVIQPGDEVA